MPQSHVVYHSRELVEKGWIFVLRANHVARMYVTQCPREIYLLCFKHTLQSFVVLYHLFLHLFGGLLVICHLLHRRGGYRDTVFLQEPIRHESPNTMRYSEPTSYLNFSEACIASIKTNRRNSSPCIPIRRESRRLLSRVESVPLRILTCRTVNIRFQHPSDP
jgi:hypothetical protein